MLPTLFDGSHAAICAWGWMEEDSWSASLSQSQLGCPWGLLLQPRAAAPDVAAACEEHVSLKLLQIKPRNHETWGSSPHLLASLGVGSPKQGWGLVMVPPPSFAHPTTVELPNKHGGSCPSGE